MKFLSRLITVEDMGLGFDSYSYCLALGRKRVVVSNIHEGSSSPSSGEEDESNPRRSPLKRMCSGKFNSVSEKSRLESLPQDVLVSIAISFLPFQL